MEKDLMTTLIEIAKKLKATKDNNNTEDFTWRPERLEDYKLPKLCLPKTRKKEYQKVQLSKVLAFIDLNKQRRFTDSATIMPISCTNKKLLSICGSSMNVSRLIKFMIEIGLISVYSNVYKYNQKDSTTNKSKTYVYYYENELLLKQYCEDNNINIYQIHNNTYNNTLVNRFKSIDNFDNSQVKFSSELHLLKPDNYSVSQFEEYLKTVLYDNYPQLAYYQQMADDINCKYYREYAELQIQFIPTFTWNKGNKAVTGIAIRATNSLCGAKKEYKAGFKGTYRKEVLDKYGFNLSKDVKSSVPRVTLSLNSGYWIEETYDIYYDIYQYLYNYNNNTLVNRFSFDEIRPIIKDLHMRGYFSSESKIGSTTFYSMNHDGDYEEVKWAMQQLKYAVKEAEGGSLYGSEIFYHESCIYLEVLKHLLEDGFFVWEVYDEWFAKKDGWTQEEYQEYVTNLLEDIANNYISNMEA